MDCAPSKRHCLRGCLLCLSRRWGRSICRLPAVLCLSYMGIWHIRLRICLWQNVVKLGAQTMHPKVMCGRLQSAFWDEGHAPLLLACARTPAQVR